MLNNSLAPIKRAFLFFGLMGVAVTSLTMGAGLQSSNDQSSAAMAMAKGNTASSDIRFAAVDPGQKVVGATKRAIAGPQQAMLVQQDVAIKR